MDFLIRGTDYLARHPNFRLVGRDEELNRLSSILMRDRASSIILTGPGGVGATTLCMGLQAARQAPDAPFDIVRKRLFWLDTNTLFALGDPAQVTHAWDRLLAKTESAGESVLIVEDARDFIEACRSTGLSHFINGLLAAVRRGCVQVILEACEDDLDVVIKCHSDVLQFCTIMPIEEPSPDELKLMVDYSTERLTAHHGIAVSEPARASAIELTTKYRSYTNRAQPERSLSLLDRALATYRLTEHRRPSNMTKEEWEARQAVMRELHNARRQGEIQIDAWETELEESIAKRSGVSFDSAEDNVLRSKIRFAQSEVDKNRHEFDALGAATDARLALTRDHVLQEFSDISGISTNKLNENEIDKLRNIEKSLTARIYGQDYAMQRLADGVKVSKLGRRNTGTPLSYLFLGPSGVGKTETAKVLAGALLDDEASLSRFDMSEYMEKHAVAKMIGAPPGYEGFESGGILTNLMRRSSSRVLLFDEIEKAHPDIFNIFLQVLSDGRLTDGIGRTVSFSDTVIIMTTNIGQTHFLDTFATHETAEAQAREELAATYRSEFLNRFAGRQNIICFQRLEIPSIEKIVMRELLSIAKAYVDRGIKFDADDSIIRNFCVDQYDPHIGARGLPGYIQAILEPQIVNSILDGKTGTATLEYSNKKLGLQW